MEKQKKWNEKNIFIYLHVDLLGEFVASISLGNKFEMSLVWIFLLRLDMILNQTDLANQIHLKLFEQTRHLI